jgi:transcriptional antiterminator RfaH
MRQNEELGKSWYAVLTKPRNEEAAQFHLNSKGIEVFFPKLLIPVANKFGRCTVPLFPNYLFVRIDALSTQYSQVTWCRGVRRLVSFGGIPSVVDDDVVNFMRDQSDAQGLIVAKSNLKIGDEVQIIKGPFKGLVGIIQQPPDTKSRVRVLMGILSRHVQVEVPTGYVNVAWVPPCPAV